MQESKYLQEMTIGEGYDAPFVLAQSGGEDEAGEKMKKDALGVRFGDNC
jgi:hypothetical protein